MEDVQYFRKKLNLRCLTGFWISLWLCCFFTHESFKRQPHKMLKCTQTIRRLLLTNCLSVFDHFVRLAHKRLNYFCRTAKGCKKARSVDSGWRRIANIDLFKFNNRETRKRWEIFSKLTIKTLEWRISHV